MTTVSVNVSSDFNIAVIVYSETTNTTKHIMRILKVHHKAKLVEQWSIKFIMWLL